MNAQRFKQYLGQQLVDQSDLGDAAPLQLAAPVARPAQSAAAAAASDQLDLRLRQYERDFDLEAFVVGLAKPHL